MLPREDQSQRVMMPPQHLRGVLRVRRYRVDVFGPEREERTITKVERTILVLGEEIHMFQSIIILVILSFL